MIATRDDSFRLVRWGRGLFDRLFRPGGFSRHVAVLAGGTAVAQGLIVLSSPVLTRLYSPTDIGTLGVFISFLGMASVATSLRYELACINPDDPQEAAALVVLSMLLVVPTTALLSFLVYLLIRSHTLGWGGLSYAALLPFTLALFLTGVFNVFKYSLVRDQKFRAVSQISVTQSGARVVSQVFFGFIKLGWLGLLFGDVVGRVCGVARAFQSTRTLLLEQRRKLGLKTMLRAAYRHRDFPIFGLPSVILDMSALNLTVPFIAKLYGLEAAGYFALVQRTLSLPVALIGNSISEVFHSQLAIMSRTGGGGRAFYLKMVRKAFLMGLIPFVLVELLSVPAASLIFGERWAMAGDLARVVAPWVLAQFVISPLSRVADVYNGQRMKLFYDAFVVTSILSVLFLAPRLHWTLIHAVSVISLYNVVGYVLYFFLLLAIVKDK